MATTVSDIIRSAMRKIGVLASGEPLPADEGDDALVVFRQMVDSWANETLLIPVVGVVTFPLVLDQAEYTIGIYPDALIPDNHIETARPQKIISAFLRDGTGTDYPQEIIAVQTYDSISRKSNASRPSRFYVRQGWPLDTILFESVPYDNETLHLSVIQPLTDLLPIVGLTEEINLPPGYERSLTYNLCLELADEYGKQVTPLIATNAVESKKWLKRQNYRTITLKVDRALTSNDKARGTYLINQGP